MGKSKEWKWGYISRNGEFAISPAFDGASEFCDGLAVVKLDWARGYIDHTGEFIIKPVFEAAGNFKDGLAVVKFEGETRYINKKGEFKEEKGATPPPSFKPETGYIPQYEYHDGRIRFVENQLFGYKDEEGNVVIKPQFFDADDFSDGLACVKKGKSSSWGYIDTSGRMVIPAQFKQAKPFHEGLAAVLTSV